MQTLIRLLGNSDYPQVESFLRKYAPSSMFLLGNSRVAGLDDLGEIYQATCLGSFRNGNLTGVIAHCWNGMILLQVPDPIDFQFFTNPLFNLPSIKQRGISGSIGAYQQIQLMKNALNLNPTQVQMDSRESLFSLNLEDIRVPTLLRIGQVRCRRAEARDFQTLLNWRLAYNIEALNSAPTDQKPRGKADLLRATIARGDNFVLYETRTGELLAYSAFNARVPDLVQIGGVYTPPDLRDKGYGRSVVAGQLKIARNEGIQSASLFSNNPQAIRAYEAIGFQRIGEMGLLILQNPWFPENHYGKS